MTRQQLMTTLDALKGAFEQLLREVEERDFEAAGGTERDMHRSALEAIARGSLPKEAIVEVAKAALRTCAIDFPRGW